MPRGTPNATTKPAQILLDLYGVVKNFAPDFEYGKLEHAIAEAGFLTRLIEIDATPCYDGSVLMRFDVLLGRAGEDGYSFERVDTVSMKMPGNPGPVTVAARVAARESVVYLLTGRLPNRSGPIVNKPLTPETDAAYPDERHVDMNDNDQELVSDDAPAVKVVERREPDGLPIFVDLYALGTPSKDVVNAVLDEMNLFLETASIEQITAVGAKNPDVVKFIKDLGTGEDVAELKKMIADRREALTLPPQGAALRRRAANARAN